MKIVPATTEHAHTMHSYFDICPESPDGTRLVFARFGADITKPADICVSDIRTGEILVAAQAENASTHSGAFQQWLSNDEILYVSNRMGDNKATNIVSLETHSQTRLNGMAQMVSPTGRLAAGFLDQNVPGRGPRPRIVALFDLASGETKPCFGVDECYSLLPYREMLDGVMFCSPDFMTFKHSKWSYDGSKFFVVFNNCSGETPPEMTNYRYVTEGGNFVKTLYCVNADGSGLRYLCDFGHHPMWSYDGTYVYFFAKYADDPKRQDMVGCNVETGEKFLIAENLFGIHPSINIDNTLIVSDLIDKRNGVAYINIYDIKRRVNETVYSYKIDDFSHATGTHPHPVWSRDFKRVYFNNVQDGVTQLYSVNLS